MRLRYYRFVCSKLQSLHHLLVLSLWLRVTEHELLLELFEELCAPLYVHEQRVNFADVGYIDLGTLPFLRYEV